MDVNIDVTLYQAGGRNSASRAGKNGFLDIPNRDHHHLEIPAFPVPVHNIQFHLKPADLTFCALDDEKTPGLIWVGGDPGNIMDVVMLPGGHVIMIINKHFAPPGQQAHSYGHWHYQLFAQNNAGDIYGIPWTSCNGGGPASANPSIKNV